MNVANKELCQELYELSGWGEEVTEFQWYLNEEPHAKGTFELVHNTEAPFYSSDTYFPAYDLSYLLWKLPPRPEFGYLSLTIQADLWIAGYIQYDSITHDNVMKTPEDAACKLAIALIKAGIIQGKESA